MSTKINPVTGVEKNDSSWNWLYKVSGTAALIAGVLVLIGGIDLIITGFRLGTINGWLSIFGNIWLLLLLKLHLGVNGVQLGQLYVLNFIDIIFMILVAIMFLGLYVALRRASKIWSIIALIQPFLGLIIFVATKQAGRSAVMGALLVISFVMLRSNTFSNATAYVGILASILLLIGDISVTIARSSIIAIFIGIGYVLLVTWFFMVSRRLFQLEARHFERGSELIEE